MDVHFFFEVIHKNIEELLNNKRQWIFPTEHAHNDHTSYCVRAGNGVLKVEKRSTKITLMWKIGRQIICPLIQVFQLDLEEEQVLSCQSD